MGRYFEDGRCQYRSRSHAGQREPRLQRVSLPDILVQMEADRVNSVATLLNLHQDEIFDGIAIPATYYEVRISAILDLFRPLSPLHLRSPRI